jgi:asparagine synthase (glutamine-hydrolysing)
LETLQHRGPDEEGIYVESGVMLGNRRLSIRGGEHGKQPIVSISGNTILIFNGEIYNAEELIKRYKIPLKPADRTSDSRMLVELFEKIGSEITTELDGSFAFCIFSKTNRTVTLARDRYGQKPLFFHRSENLLSFASEIRPLLSLHPELRTRLNLDAFYQYFIFQNIVNEETLFEGIEELQPGSLLVLNLESFKIEKKQYWRHAYSNSSASSGDLADLVWAGLKSQMVHAGDSFSALLSGGVDSSLIALAIKSSFTRDVPKFYHVFYPDNVAHEFNELAQAQSFALDQGINFRPVPYTYSTWVKDLEITCEALEQPKMGQSCINYAAFRQSRESGRVTFTGAGADELFAGYPWRYPVQVEQGIPTPLEAVDYLGDDSSRVLRLLTVSEYLKLFPSFTPSSLFDLKNAVVAEVLSRVDYDDEAPWGKVTKYLAFDFLTFLPGLLAVDDRLSMYNGVEVRTPFLANDLVQRALSLPTQSLLMAQNGELFGKQPLRDILSRAGLPSVGMGKKRGFSAPDSNWLSQYLSKDGELLSKRNRIWDLMNRSTFLELFEDHLVHSNKRALMWSFVSMSFFLRDNS